MEEQEIIEQVETEEVKVEEIVKEETPIKESKPKKRKKAEKIPVPSDDTSALKVGDKVLITGYIGTFLNGRTVPDMIQSSYLYVNKIDKGIVELKLPSGRIVGSVRQTVLTQIK